MSKYNILAFTVVNKKCWIYMICILLFQGNNVL
jgi:hypothetical protein